MHCGCWFRLNGCSLRWVPHDTLRHVGLLVQLRIRYEGSLARLNVCCIGKICGYRWALEFVRRCRV